MLPVVLLIDESINLQQATDCNTFLTEPAVPKLGMKPIRKDALIKATIEEIGRLGSLDVTVAQIAGRAGVSSALAHHYFGSKEEIFLAAMRHILALYGAEVRAALASTNDPTGRVYAVIRASFSESNFRREAVSAWLNFWSLSQTVPEARRLLAIYQRRLQSNLLHSLRPVFGQRAPRIADHLAALIDGLYLREVLKSGAPDGAAAIAVLSEYLQRELREIRV